MQPLPSPPPWPLCKPLQRAPTRRLPQQPQSCAGCRSSRKAVSSAIPSGCAQEPGNTLPCVAHCHPPEPNSAAATLHPRPTKPAAAIAHQLAHRKDNQRQYTDPTREGQIRRRFTSWARRYPRHHGIHTRGTARARASHNTTMLTLLGLLRRCSSSAPVTSRAALVVPHGWGARFADGRPKTGLAGPWNWPPLPAAHAPQPLHHEEHARQLFFFLFL
jgi:hypothetical protein